MMRQNIANRPMFQTPQRKAAGGIMAGVAPINAFMGPMGMSNGGDVFSFDDGKLNINIPQDVFVSLSQLNKTCLVFFIDNNFCHLIKLKPHPRRNGHI